MHVHVYMHVHAHVYACACAYVMHMHVGADAAAVRYHDVPRVVAHAVVVARCQFTNRAERASIGHRKGEKTADVAQNRFMRLWRNFCRVSRAKNPYRKTRPACGTNLRIMQ